MKARLPQGYGKQSMNQLMAQAQKMQEDVKNKQAELEETLYDVTSGGGMISLTMSGKPVSYTHLRQGCHRRQRP